MTTKELLYIEDALSHAQYVQSKCAQLAGELSDGELQSFARQLEQSNSQIYQSFLNLL